MSDGLKSMKLDREEKQERAESPRLDDQPEYPYGLKIHVDKSMFGRVDPGKIPQVGDKLMLLARVEVTDVHKEPAPGDVFKVSCGLQITDMDLKPVEKEKMGAAESLYGESKS